MSRKEKLFLNTIIGMSKQIITVLCGFILPRYYLLYYGSSVNGLISSIVNFLGLISLLDMGVGAVVQANLYKPLVDRDVELISKIVKSSEKFFRRLGYIFVGYISVLCIIYPKIVKFETWYTISLIVIISLSTFVQYFFGITNQLLLNADQRSFVHLLLQTATILVNTMVAVLMMKMGASIHLVKLMTAFVYSLRPFCQMLFVKKYYKLNRKIDVIGEPIKQKWNGFSQHFAAVVCQNIDVAVLTIFSTLENISIYSIYFYVTNGVEQILLTAATGLEALLGNMIAKGENDKLNRTFSAVEWITHTVVTIVFTVTACTIVPFISVYTRGVTDTNYIKPIFAVVLVSAYGFRCLRIPYFTVIKAAGHFKETQNGAYVSAGLNIILTLLMVYRFDLIGVAIGTLVAMIYHTVYFVWYLNKNILIRSPKFFAAYIVSDSIVSGVSYILSKGVMLYDVSYKAWIILALEVTVIVFFVSLCVNFIVYRSIIICFIHLLKERCI